MNITSISSSTTTIVKPTTTAPPPNGTSMVRISNYSGVLTTSSSTFTRNGRSGTFYFEAIEVTPKRTGNYTFKSYSAIDSYGYLYTNPFDPLNTTSNLLTHVDDNEDETSDQFSLAYPLKGGTSYILIFTTFDAGVTGPFSVVGVGPGRVSLVRNNVPTVTATSTVSTTKAPNGMYDTIYCAPFLHIPIALSNVHGSHFGINISSSKLWRICKLNYNTYFY
ncbi:unnamed protein product [Rotaria magnacalcarata]|uniref:Uncharacterized protein n=2 Tax=Rotaria magnacalcarata TaxID=392030 RepID=A0A820AK25_9BILA|nr:unnamed protein product [Rotaria magnacalcarata]